MDAIAKGGRTFAGGSRHKLGLTFFEPTVNADANATMKLAKAETFGRLCALFRFEEENEAIAAATHMEFDLAADFYTRDLARPCL
jgi:succinate-semialdehyde dehydrogenase/glutarate-semialdehyde dehydrogenase